MFYCNTLNFQQPTFNFFLFLPLQITITTTYNIVNNSLLNWTSKIMKACNYDYYENFIIIQQIFFSLHLVALSFDPLNELVSTIFVEVSHYIQWNQKWETKWNKSKEKKLCVVAWQVCINQLLFVVLTIYYGFKNTKFANE